MSIQIEDRVRDALHDRARTVEVEHPRPEAVFERVRQRQVRRRTVRMTAAAIVAVAVIGAGVAVRSGSSTVQTGRANQPPPAVLGQPAYITLPGWHVSAFFLLGEYTEYQFSDGTRTLQVSFYDSGSREGNKTNPTEVRLRGTTGITTDEGAPRYRVDWDEQGRTWEADGSPFASIDEMLAVLDTVSVVDETTWKAEFPPGDADRMLANTDVNVSWYEDRGISCFDSQNSVPCR